MDKRQRMLDPNDRISKLPDVLLSHILSFLPTKYAVRTSVLSTRWKPLWTIVPVLDLNYNDFTCMPRNGVGRKRREADFVTFVYWFLKEHEQSSIRKFVLAGRRHDLSLIQSWISIVKRHRVQVLEIETCYHMEPVEPIGQMPSNDSAMFLSLSFYHLDPLHNHEDGFSSRGRLYLRNSNPSSFELLMSTAKEWNVKDLDLTAENFRNIHEYHQNMFTGNTLVILKLRYMVLHFPKASVCFPKLKVLHLKKIIFKSNRSGSNLITNGCPLLEELEIERNNSWDNLLSLTVASQTLRRLKVRFEGKDCRKQKLETHIDAPNLQYLDLQDGITLNYVIGDLSSLTEAELSVWMRKKSQYCHEPTYGNDLYVFLRKICNVGYLSLSYHTLLALEKAHSCHLQPFHNLTCLKICVSEFEFDFVCESWKLILQFLASSPNLKHFIWQGSVFGFHTSLDSTTEHVVPRCLVSSVETIQIEHLTGEGDEIKFVRYFLRNCKVLKKMALKFQYSNENTEWMKLAIFMLPRVSATCEIEVGVNRRPWDSEDEAQLSDEAELSD